MILHPRGARGPRPGGPVVLNRASPQSRALLHWYPLAGDVKDYTGRATGATVTGSKVGSAASIGGRVLEQDGTGQYVSVSGDQLNSLNFSGGISLTAWVKLRVATPVTGGLTGMVAQLQRPGGQDSHYPWTDGTAYINTLRAADDRVTFTPATLVTLTEWHLIGVTWAAGGTWRFWQNAQVAASAAAQGLTSFEALGIGRSSTSYSLNGWLADVRVYGRELTSADMWELYAPQSRWDLYQVPGTRAFFEIGGGGGYTLTADAGSYTLTGTAATLRVARKITADAGSYSLSGTDAALKVGRKVTAEAGSYSLTGTDATLRTTRLLTASGGSYALSGTDAALKAGRLVTASSGSYVITGTAATLDYSGETSTYTLTAEAGSYALTGTAATLRVARAVTAEAGSYALTGTAATLRLTRLLAADGGSYSLTGTAASLLVGRAISASAGSYTLTGTDATLTTTRVLSAVAGSYAITGTAATLTYSGEELATTSDTYTAELQATLRQTATFQTAKTYTADWG